MPAPTSVGCATRCLYLRRAFRIERWLHTTYRRGAARLRTWRLGPCRVVGRVVPVAARKALRHTSSATPCTDRCRCTTQNCPASRRRRSRGRPGSTSATTQPRSDCDQIACQVTREIVTTRPAHWDVVPRTTDSSGRLRYGLSNRQRSRKVLWRWGFQCQGLGI